MSRCGTASSTGGVEHVEGKAGDEPGLEQHALDPPGLGVEHLARRAGLTPAAMPIGVRGRMLDVPPADTTDMAVRARADAPPVAAWPVARLWRHRAGSSAPSSRPRTSPIRRRPAGRRPAGTCRPGRRRRASRTRPALIRRASAVPSSTIRAYALTWSGPPPRAHHAHPPVVQRLPRRAVDEVEADLLEPGRPRPTDDLRHAAPVVGAGRAPASTCGTAICIPNETRLKPPPAAPPAIRVDRFGIGLGRHLGVWRQLRTRHGSRRASPTGRRREQGGRAPAEEDRVSRHGRWSPSTVRASRISSIAALAYVAREAPELSPSSDAV